ncbi:MAG: hypothetical protein OXC54_11400 [Rhodospirillaceae bacterium]|nr:hypothetical protein [Rhodospirillaceae bacterium]
MVQIAKEYQWPPSRKAISQLCFITLLQDIHPAFLPHGIRVIPECPSVDPAMERTAIRLAPQHQNPDFTPIIDSKARRLPLKEHEAVLVDLGREFPPPEVQVNREVGLDDPGLGEIFQPDPLAHYHASCDRTDFGRSN